MPQDSSNYTRQRGPKFQMPKAISPTCILKPYKIGGYDPFILRSSP